MAHYFLRVELHNHETGDYEQLHNELASVGYYRVYYSNQQWLDLPTGEYHKESTNTLNVELASVNAAILRVVQNNNNKTKDYYFVLTSSSLDGITWRLKPNTDVSKRPGGR